MATQILQYQIIFFLVVSSAFLKPCNCLNNLEPEPLNCVKRDEKHAAGFDRIIKFPWMKASEADQYNCEDDKKDYIVSHHILVNTLTWSSSQNFCRGFGANLCTAEQVCPYDRQGPVYGVVSGDSWTPDGGLKNNWIQLGNKPHSPCTQTANPSWGETSSANAFKGRVFCCKSKARQNRFEWTHNTLSYYISWANAMTFCSKKNGFSLCRADQICDKGVPVMGILKGDHWSPTADKSNEWIQIGTGHPTCLRHETYGPPEWGKYNSKRGNKGHVVFCCKDEPDECTDSDSDSQLCAALAKAGMCDSSTAQRHCCETCAICKGGDKGSLCYLVDQNMCMNKEIRSACCKTCRKLMQ